MLYIKLQNTCVVIKIHDNRTYRITMLDLTEMCLKAQFINSFG